MLASVLDPLYQLMAAVLAAIYSVIPNYAVAIMGLVVFVLALLTPLTLKGLRSTIKIQKLVPEQKKLQQQYKDDREALNQAIMELYKEHKVNPASGCLPFLIQSPFWIALFGVLQGMSRVVQWVPNGQPFTEAARLRGDGPHPEGAIDVGFPKHLPQGSRLYNSLFGAENPPPGSNLPKLSHAPGEVKAFGIDLARSASETVSEGFITFLPYVSLIAITIAFQYLAQRQVTRRNPQAAAANPQMQMVTKVMPFLFGVWGWAFQAGLTLYWATSAALRMVQQWGLYRFDPTLADSVKEKKVELEKGAKGGGKAAGAGAGGKAAPPKGGPAKGGPSKAIPPKGGPGKVTGPKGGGPAKGSGSSAAPDGDGPSPDTPKLKASGGAAGASTANGRNGAARPQPVVDGATTASGARPPGRQQPKKRRKGR